MKTLTIIASTIVVCMALCGSVHSQQDKATYIRRVTYPLFKEMEHHADSVKAAQDSATSSIREAQKKEKKLKDSTETELRFDVSKIVRPASTDEFTTVFHFPPTPQDLTGTCWAFSGTSFIESEVYRKTGRKIKLSEMHTVYWEWVEKVRRFVRERGESVVSSGSEEEGVPRIMGMYGAVPREVYDGLDPNYPHYSHDLLDGEIDRYLTYVKEHDLWDENAVIASVRILLDKYIGKPPESFLFEGKQYTPKSFLTDVLTIKPEDYVCLVSTLKYPFHTRCLFDASDNWRLDSSYYNLPLDEWYAVIKSAIQKGYSLSIGGGTSEPGYYGLKNIAVIPDFDIPQSYISQDSREYRIYRGTTGDDHGLHLVGFLRKGGRDWFLIKDSGSGSRKGNVKGYFFFRDDYVRLKMLSIMVSKDVVPSLSEAGKAK